MMSLSRLRTGLALIRPRELALALADCPFCGPTVLVRLRDDSIGLRCVRCAASAIHIMLGWVLREMIVDLAVNDACELSARGPLVAYLRRRARSVATSEYFAGIAPGAFHQGVRCEDVQNLSYADASFDLVTHTEVLEHVPDDARAFTELLRVLRRGGIMVFTVPMHGGAQTVERARLCDGVVEHLQEPVYHFDPLRGESILAYRDYGRDILDRLCAAGFTEARVIAPERRVPWLGCIPVVFARKAA